MGDLSCLFLEVRGAAVLPRADFYGEWNRGVYVAAVDLRKGLFATSNFDVDFEAYNLLYCGVTAKALSGDAFLTFFPFFPFLAEVSYILKPGLPASTCTPDFDLPRAVGAVFVRKAVHRSKRASWCCTSANLVSALWIFLRTAAEA